jgi:hypothetical protein
VYSISVNEVDDLASGPRARTLFEVPTSTVREQRRNPGLIYKMKGCELVNMADKTIIERRGWSNDVRTLG